jgi:hypothetical protein
MWLILYARVVDSHCSPSLAFTPLIVSYTVEILPFHLRAKGFNIFNFVISLALIFNQYVNPIALLHLTWKYYVRLFILVCIFRLFLNLSHRQIVYVCWLAFELVFLYFTIVETKNLSLEETAALFDGETAIEHIAGKATHEVGGSPRDIKEDVDEKGSFSAEKA